MSKVVAASPLLVADGHHRYETALAYQAEQRARGAESEGEPGGSEGRRRYRVRRSARSGGRAFRATTPSHGHPPGGVRAASGVRLPRALPPASNWNPLPLRGQPCWPRWRGPGALARRHCDRALAGHAASGGSGRRLRPRLEPHRRRSARLPPHDLAYEHDLAQPCASQYR